jgi:hypothetical protein
MVRQRIVALGRWLGASVGVQRYRSRSALGTSAGAKHQNVPKKCPISRQPSSNTNEERAAVGSS